VAATSNGTTPGTTKNNAAHVSAPSSVSTPVEQHGARLIKYPFPIRPGVQGFIQLPEDLNMREAKRIAAFVSTLAIEDEQGAEPLRAITAGHYTEE
jgi:hypothetical protein